MKKSEIFHKAALAVLDSNMSIGTKQEIIGVLLWEKYFAEVTENSTPEEENADGKD